MQSGLSLGIAPMTYMVFQYGKSFRRVTQEDYLAICCLRFIFNASAIVASTPRTVLGSGTES